MKTKRKSLALLMAAVLVLGVLPAVALADPEPGYESTFIVDTSAIAEPIDFGSNKAVTIQYRAEDPDAPYLYVFDEPSWAIDGQPFTNGLWYGDSTTLLLFPPSLEAGTHTVTCQVNMILQIDLMTGEPMPMFGPFPEISFDYTVKEPPEYEDENVFISTDTFDLYIPGVQVRFAQLENRDGDNYTYSVLLDEATEDNAQFNIAIQGTESGNTRVNGINNPQISAVFINTNNTLNHYNKIIDETLCRSLPCDMSAAVNDILTVHFYTYYGSSHNEYTVNFTKNATQFSNEQITGISSEVGQFENVNRFLDVVTGRETYLVVPYGTESADVTLTLGEGFSGVQVNGGETVEAVDHKVTVTLAASKTGTDNIIVPISLEGEKGAEFNLVCTSQKYDAMPDALVEYLCIGSQYTNGAGLEDYGLRAVRSLVGSNFDAGGARVNGVGGTGPTSLGNFGGYITYYYETPITDDPNNPYGIDFITFGNSFEGSNEFGEPGQVWVSENGTDWYALAGGMHYEDYADWDFQITYIRNEDGGTTLEYKQGERENWGVAFPLPEYYPYYDFSGVTDRITMSGIAFLPSGETNEYGNTLPPFAGFGYTDSGAKYTSLPGEDWSGLSEEETELLSARNIAGNPYQGTYLRGSREFSAVTDGMDLAWAVDADGQPVSFPNGVHYVKIVNASSINAGAIGEKSCEVNMVRVAQANETAVGVTAAPEYIRIDGSEIALQDGVYVYDAVVDGAFLVDVGAPESTNVYINNLNNRMQYRSFDGMPTHKIVRVIVQEGEKEPVIYLFNLTEKTGGEPEPTATLTLNCGEGTINGNRTYTLKFDEHMAGAPLPTPYNRYTRWRFDGWYLGQTLVTTYPDVVKDTAYTAKWTNTEAETVAPSENTINVTFRLIGSTLAELKDEKDGIDLANGDYKGAEYVNWVPTTAYTMPENATIADLFIKAMADAGLRSVGADKGYVSTIYAPAAYGGYELSEFTNGNFSGWMYTMDGKHTNAIKEQTMHDGAEIIWHYVNDYRFEVEDWFDEPLWPSLAEDATYYSLWLLAPDVAPPTGGGTSGGDDGGEADKDKDEKQTVFEDVPEDAYYAEAVAWAVENGITDGVTETEFKPESTCNRGQIVTFLWRAAGSPKPTSTVNPFVDVTETDYFYEAVLWAVENGVTDGVDATHFAPDSPCTREQAVTFMWRAEGGEQVSGAASFADVDEDDYAAAAVAWAVANGITDGVSDTRFAPENECTRGQIVTFLYREYGEKET